MMTVYAERFHRATHFLAMFRAKVESVPPTNKPFIGTTPGALLEMGHELAADLEKLALSGAKSTVDALCEHFEGGALDNEHLRFIVTHLYRTMNDELNGVLFLALTKDFAKLYEQKEPPFGQDVYDKFPDAIEDISEAAKCLALDRADGCIYHLACAMDVALQTLCKRLTITVDPTWDWQRMLDETLVKINEMPKTTKAELERKDQFFGAHADLHAVRRAWRNPHMHARLRGLTPARAAEIYNAVRGFIRHLTEVV